MTKEEQKMKCGFCNEEILTYNELIKFRKKTGSKTVMLCPHCHSILGIYSYN